MNVCMRFMRIYVCVCVCTQVLRWLEVQWLRRKESARLEFLLSEAKKKKKRRITELKQQGGKLARADMFMCIHLCVYVYIQNATIYVCV
jgi:hypothetical protein